MLMTMPKHSQGVCAQGFGVGRSPRESNALDRLATRGVLQHDRHWLYTLAEPKPV